MFFKMKEGDEKESFRWYWVQNIVAICIFETPEPLPLETSKSLFL